MTKLYTKLLLIFIFVLLTARATAQQILTDAVKQKQLTDLSASQNTNYQAEHQKALKQAALKGWVTYKVTPDGGVISLQKLDNSGFPLYLKALNNIIAAATTRTNSVQTGGSLGLNLNGSSAIMANKLAIWDGSSVYAAHQEFAGKTITIKDASVLTLIDHASHVAGTMLAKGVYAPAQGMAFGATTLQSYDFDNDATEMAAAAAGLLVSNHSYDYIAGWDFNSTQNRWEWYGVPGASQDYKFGFYGSDTQTFDKIAFNAPKYLICQAAGNNRTVNGPAVGSTYYGFTSATDATFINKGPRPANISNNDSYDIISTTANAKNILAVGAVNPLPFGPSTGADVTIAPFSSWGPTDDGRIKPDICGDGVNVTSCSIASAASYTTFSGTSMATPNVSGSLFLLQEYYAQKNSGNFMLAATLKGLACHTALDAGNPGPDYIYGWGLLDMAKAAQAITDNGTKSLISEKTLVQGQTQTFTVVASGSSPLMASISWTDPAGPATTDGVVNDRTPKLVNDLDIRVSDGTTTFKPWILDPNNPANNATTGDNVLDNIEQVYIPGAVPGKTYTITVTHKGTLTNASQNYSLIVTGIGGAAYCTSNPLSSADSRIDNVTLSDLNFTAPAGCTTYSNYTNLTSTLEQGKTYPISVTLGTCGANFSKIAKVYIDWNGNGLFTDAGELAATSGVFSTNGVFTANITVPGTVTPGSYSLMRVIVSETTDPTSINPCGTYAKGETQDYRVKFVKPSLDAGIIAINTPAVTGTCPSATSAVSVRIKNFGTATISNIPVKVTITALTGGAVTTLTDVYPGTLTPLAEDDFILTGTFNAVAGGSYTVTATTQLVNDAIASNNQTSLNAVINQPPVITNASAFFCTDAKIYSLNAADAGTLWYKNLADATPFTAGASVSTTTAPINGVYYAGLNDFSGSIGPATKNVFTAGGYNQFTPTVTVSTRVPMVIESARLYIGNSGSLTFNVTDANGAAVFTRTINVVATRTTPGPGAQTDDPADVGKVYNLGLVLPAAGTYNITITYPDNATLYRNNGGVTGYPFSLPINIFNIKSNNATSGIANDTAYYKNFYYYFYDMHVRSYGCLGAARVAVPLTKAAITQNGLVLSSNFTTGNQWYLNGIAIAGATAQNYTPLVSGIYRVDAVTTNSGCISKSDDLSFVLPSKGTGDGADISLAVFPVPAGNQLNLAFVAKVDESLSILIKNSIGQGLYSDVEQIKAGPYNTILNIATIPDGIYFLQLKIGDKTYVKRVTILR